MAGGSETGERRETELALLFERLFSDYLNEVSAVQPIAMYSNKLRLITKARPGVSVLNISKDGSVTIEASAKPPGETVADLSAAFDAMVEVTAFASGQKSAYEGAAKIATSVLKQFSGSKHATGVRSSLMRGYLRDTMPLGVPGEELLLPEGIPKNSTVLLESPQGVERELLLMAMLRAEAECGGASVAVLGTRSPADMRKAMADHGIKAGQLEAKGQLKLVDWFSYREKAVNGVEQDKSGVLKSSGDLTNLALAIDKAHSQIGFSPCTRVLSDVVSPAINSHGAGKTHDFVQNVSGKLKREGTMMVWAFDPEGLDTRTLTSLHNIADAVLSVQRRAAKCTLEVVALRGARFNRGQLQLVQVRGDIQISSEAIDEGSALVSLQSLPGVDEAAARALFEAGFQSVERLEKASAEAMAKAIGEQAATRLHEYMHSIDYARRMLNERSRKWVEKGKRALVEGNRPGALENLKRALEISEENAEAWYEMGQFRFDEGEMDEARDCFMKAQRLDKVYEGEWYGEDKAEMASLFTCSTCGEVIEAEVLRCPGCGVVLSLDERRRLAESLARGR